MGQYLTDFQIGQIPALRKAKFTIDGITAEPGIPKSTVGRIVNKVDKELATVRKLGSGRLEALLASDINQIKKILITKPGSSAPMIRKELVEKTNKEISISTIRNYLYELGFIEKSPINKPYLTPNHKQVRLRIARDWCYKGEEF